MEYSTGNELDRGTNQDCMTDRKYIRREALAMGSYTTRDRFRFVSINMSNSFRNVSRNFRGRRIAQNGPETRKSTYDMSTWDAVGHAFSAHVL